jgi:hypothetical protein
LKVLNFDEMVIADNQALAPHFRYASGLGGKSSKRSPAGSVNVSWGGNDVGFLPFSVS